MDLYFKLISILLLIGFSVQYGNNEENLKDNPTFHTLRPIVTDTTVQTTTIIDPTPSPICKHPAKPYNISILIG